MTSVVRMVLLLVVVIPSGALWQGCGRYKMVRLCGYGFVGVVFSVVLFGSGGGEVG